MEERNEEKEYRATVVGRWLKSNQPREQDPDRDVARRPKMGTRFEGLAQLSHTSRARSRLKILSQFKRRSARRYFRRDRSRL